MPGGPPARWGWHRLTDDWARELVARAGVHRGELVLDIGAGTGALTAPLLRTGARVVAIELHPGRAQWLRDRFAGLTVVQVDAADLRLPRRPFRVVANPPFAIVSPLLRRLLGRGSRLTSADLVLPRHVALRWAGEHPPGVRRWSRDFRITAASGLPRSAFRPRPPCEIVTVRLERRRAP